MCYHGQSTSEHFLEKKFLFENDYALNLKREVFSVKNINVWLNLQAQTDERKTLLLHLGYQSQTKYTFSRGDVTLTKDLRKTLIIFYKCRG